jgi:hypothetical protein
MMEQATKDSVYGISEDVVAREAGGDIVIVPLTAEVAGPENPMFTLNRTGQAVWKKLDGRKTLGEIAAELAGEFHAPLDVVERGVLKLATDLASRKIIR